MDHRWHPADDRYRDRDRDPFTPGSRDRFGSDRSFASRTYGDRGSDRSRDRDREWDRDRTSRDDRYGREGREERGVVARTADEVRSWFGDDEARRRRDRDERESYRGRDPRGRDERAHEVMTRDVETVHPRDDVEHAARLMRDRDVGAIPVATDDGRMVGMLTDRDITVRVVAEGRDPRACQVHDVMTERTFAGRPDDRIEDLMQLMARHRVRRLPILDEHDHILGIVSQADLAREAGESVGEGRRRQFADTVGEISERSRRAYRG